MNHHQFLKDNILTRREALASMGSGLGTAALATLLGANNAHGVETKKGTGGLADLPHFCLLYTSPSPRDRQKSRMPSSA